MSIKYCKFNIVALSVPWSDVHSKSVCGGLWSWLESDGVVCPALCLERCSYFVQHYDYRCVVWDRTPHRLVERYQCVSGTCCLQYQGQRWKQNGLQNSCPLSNKRCVTSYPKIISFIFNAAATTTTTTTTTAAAITTTTTTTTTLILLLMSVLAGVLLVTGVLHGSVSAEHNDQPGDPGCLWRSHVSGLFLKLLLLLLLVVVLHWRHSKKPHVQIFFASSSFIVDPYTGVWRWGGGSDAAPTGSKVGSKVNILDENVGVLKYWEN